MEEGKQNLIENNIIIISKQTLDFFLKQINPAELIALYTFYYYTAKWQKTNQPKVAIKYTAKGLKWGNHKVIRVKKQLEDFKLIEEIKDINKTTGQVQGWYIKLNYIWKKETQIPQVSNVEVATWQCPHCLSTTCGEQQPNALSANSINALSANNNINNSVELLQTTSAGSVQKIFNLFYKINPTINFGNKTQRKIAEELIKQLGEEKVIKMTEYAIQIFGQQYAPTITNPLELKNKIALLAAYWKKQETISKPNIVSI